MLLKLEDGHEEISLIIISLNTGKFSLNIDRFSLNIIPRLF